MDSKQIDLSQVLINKGIQRSVPSLSQGVLFIKIVILVTLYAAIRRETAVYVDNRTHFKAVCVIVRKPHKRADKVRNFGDFFSVQRVHVPIK